MRRLPAPSQASLDDHAAHGIPRDMAGLVTLRIFESNKPVIGAINGAAIGVGATMLLPFDYLVASEKAKFGCAHQLSMAHHYD